MKRFFFIFILALIPFTSTTVSAESDLPLVSEAGIIIDAKSGKVLYEKNINKKMYPASLTKVATAIYAIEHGDQNELVTVSKKAAEADGSSVFIEPGEKIKLSKLIAGMLINSGNDAAIAIAEHMSGSEKLFMEDLNEFLRKEVKVTDTHFTNPHGLFDKNHVTTASDLAKITQYAMKNEIFREDFGKKKLPWKVETWDTTLVTHHKILKGELPYKGITGGKTGFVSKAGYTLISTATRGEQDLIAVTLKAPSNKDAYSDTELLFNYGFENFKSAKIDKKTLLYSADHSKSYKLNKDLYYTHLISDEPSLKTSNDGILSISNQEGRAIGSFNLKTVADVRNTAVPASFKKEAISGDANKFSVSSLGGLGCVILIMLITVFLKKSRKKRSDYRNRY
ncbi:D-alanyl-D-alanine carboxypeptidase family protein [Peribacillus sp. CSMR9]|uniref:D-alanyl-D-alanine carboxypeptidase family protein n=1 Tax=Peribacillus sp. CSMR9 TaxID=2981350 RepID=UPI00295464FA|nr:D-alanyl-D-alanine carboxypeptidase family protein [Peribacillus sp. CSMR9]MDV7767508.1 D-alanyl-D-alanine carboxypeptidase [Peribacillus sp. CSMR9]